MTHPTHFKVGQDIYISAENLVDWLRTTQAHALERSVEPTEFEEVPAYWRGREIAFAVVEDYISEVSGAKYE
jgi:hypothetical protein